MASIPEPALSDVHRTALSAAAFRGAHLLERAESKIFRDELALQLAGLTDDQAASMVARTGQTPALWVLRSRFTEDRLQAALGRVAQYVILGAGLDSYALRMADRLGALTVFEVDDPPLQSWKRRRIEMLDLPVPPQLRFVPCDFEHRSIAEALGENGFDQTAPSFVSWLGVTQYLTREAIEQTLGWAGARPSGSELVLTFVPPGPRAEALKVASAKIGLSFTTFFTPDEMTHLLREAGFAQVDHLSPALADELYFQGRSDGLTAPEHELLVTARL